MQLFPSPLLRIRERAKDKPNDVALIFDDERFTNSQLDARSSAVANGLLAARLPVQSRIALLDFNHSSFAEIMLGALKANHTLCPINARLAAPEVAWILNDARAPVLFVGRDHYAMVEAIESQLSTVKLIVAVHGGHNRWPSFETWRNDQSSVDPHLPFSLDLDIVQLYTSGTTGNPKGVRHTHRTWGEAAAEVSIANPSCFADDCIYLIVLPFFHVAGFNPLCFLLAGGGKIVVTRRNDPETIVTLLEKHAVTNTLLVPALIIAILNSPVRPKSLPAMRALSYGASPIAQDVLARAREFFACPFEHLYGMTENLGVATNLPPSLHDPSSGKLKSCGKPYAHCEIKVVDEEGHEKSAGEVGEIIMKGTWIMRGYWNQPEATAATVREGWLWTGDAGYFDADGYLYIHDRVKDMIKTGSENVFPAEVENALFGHPSIADAAVIGVPDERWDEVIKAVVVLKPGTKLDATDIERHLRTRIGGFKIPRSYEVVEALPRNASGKVLRRKLREQFGAKQ